MISLDGICVFSSGIASFTHKSVDGTNQKSWRETMEWKSDYVNYSPYKWQWLMYDFNTNSTNPNMKREEESGKMTTIYFC